MLKIKAGCVVQISRAVNGHTPFVCQINSRSDVRQQLAAGVPCFHVMRVKVVRLVEQINGRFRPNLRPFLSHPVPRYRLHQPVHRQQAVFLGCQRIGGQRGQGVVPRQFVAQRGCQFCRQGIGVGGYHLQRDVVRGQKAAQVQQVGRPRRLPRMVKSHLPRRHNCGVVGVRRFGPRPQFPPPLPVQPQVSGRTFLPRRHVRRRLFQRQGQIAQFFRQRRQGRFCRLVQSARLNQSTLPKRRRFLRRKYVQRHHLRLGPAGLPRGNQYVSPAAGQPGAQVARFYCVHVVIQQQPARVAAVQPAQHYLPGGRRVCVLHRQAQRRPQPAQAAVQCGRVIRLQQPDQVVSVPLLVGVSQGQLRLAHAAQPGNGLGDGHRVLRVLEGSLDGGQSFPPAGEVRVGRRQVVQRELGRLVMVFVFIAENFIAVYFVALYQVAVDVGLAAHIVCPVRLVQSPRLNQSGVRFKPGLIWLLQWFRQFSPHPAQSPPDF